MTLKHWVIPWNYSEKKLVDEDDSTLLTESCFSAEIFFLADIYSKNFVLIWIPVQIHLRDSMEFQTWSSSAAKTTNEKKLKLS